MSETRREIKPSDILLPQDYIPVRKELKAKIVEIKRPRRIEIGPIATCYFENFATMVHQINEMLYIEKAGAEAIADEIAAYGTMVPNGQELTATVMFEIDDPIRRANFLSRLGGIEETMFIRFAGHTVKGVPEEDLDRTAADGKASSVQFLHFPFTAEQRADFMKSGTEVIIGFDHPQYAHMCVLQEASRAALAGDFAS